MPYSTAEARQQVLDVMAAAADRLAVSLGLLSGAYELLDERSAERLEELMFGPVQHAYGRLRRAHAAFAQRSNLPARDFQPAAEGAPARGVQGLIGAAAETALIAEHELAELQDSMLPVEVGDPELRAGLEEVRSLLARVGSGSRELLRTFGR